MTNDLDKTVAESGRSDYEVGYKKPPRNTQFRKGKSGNPAGRPKRTLDIRKSISDMLIEPVGVRIDGKVRKVSTLEAGLLTLRANLLKGEPQAFNTLVRMLNAAGMIKLPQESETDVSITLEEQRRLEQAWARLSLNGSSKEAGHE